MSSPKSPSPPPKSLEPFQPQSQLPDLSLLSTPSLHSTLPLPRSNLASSAFRRSSLNKNRLASSSRARRARSIANTASHHSSDGSLGDFSMENYTIDIAQLGKKEGGVRPVGYEQAFASQPNYERNTKPKGTTGTDDDNENEDFLDGYVMDLGGLGDKPSSVVVEDLIPTREEVPSDDEGPEDFTQNMEAWMRGHNKWERKKDEDIAEGHEPDPDPERNLDEIIADDGLAEESTFEPLATSTPAPMTKHVIIDKGIEEEQEEVQLHAPPLIRGNTEMLQDQAAEEVFDRISALQAEVERLRLQDEARRTGYRDLEKQHQELKEHFELANRDHRNNRAALQDDYDRMKQESADTIDSLQREKKNLDGEYKSATDQIRLLEIQRSKAQEVEETKRELNYEQKVKELEAAKALLEAEREAAESRIKSLQQDLDVSKAQSDEVQKSYRKRVMELETEIEARKKEVALDRKECIDRANEVASLSEKLGQMEGENSKICDENKAIKNELQQALDELKETHRVLESVEEENDRLVQQNERQAETITDLRASLQSHESQKPLATSSTITPINMIDEATHQSAIEAMRQQHQSLLSQLGADHGKELEELRNALRKAAEGIRKREKKISRAHSDELASLKVRITQLQNFQALSHPPPTITTTEVELRSAIRVLNAKLQTVNASVTSLRAEADLARQEKDEAEQANAIINARLEIRFVEAFEEREKEWERRIDLLFRERERMGKALMLGWGREQCGPTQHGGRDKAQKYRYKFAEKM